MVFPWAGFLQTPEVVEVANRFIILSTAETGVPDIHVPYDPDTQTLLQAQRFVNTGNVTGVTTVSAKYLTAVTSGDAFLFPPGIIDTFVQASSTELLDCFCSQINVSSIETGTFKLEVYATPNSDDITSGTLLFTTDDAVGTDSNSNSDVFLSNLITLPVDQFLTFVITPTDLVLTYSVLIVNCATITRTP